MQDLLLVLVVILVIVFLWRGTKTLPEFGRTLGKAVSALRREASGGQGETRDEERRD